MIKGRGEVLESLWQVGGQVAGSGQATEDADQESAVTVTRVMVSLDRRGIAGWSREGRGEEGLLTGTIKILAQGYRRGHLPSRALPLSHLCDVTWRVKSGLGTPPAWWGAQTQHRSGPTHVAEALVLECTCKDMQGRVSFPEAGKVPSGGPS